MNNNQVESQRDESKGKPEKQGGKSGAVLGEINEDARKQGGKPDDKDDDTGKHGNKKGAVLGEINDDSRKDKK